MRYSASRKYPITQMKKYNQLKKQDSYMDLSLGTATGLLALVFAEGVLLGYMIRRWKS